MEEEGNKKESWDKEQHHNIYLENLQLFCFLIPQIEWSACLSLTLNLRHHVGMEAILVRQQHELQGTMKLNVHSNCLVRQLFKFIRQILNLCSKAFDGFRMWQLEKLTDSYDGHQEGVQIQSVTMGPAIRALVAQWQVTLVFWLTLYITHCPTMAIGLVSTFTQVLQPPKCSRED